MPGETSSHRVLSLLFILGLISQVIGIADTNIPTVSASANAFVVRYCTHDSYTGDPPDSSDRYLFV